jgi:uncharacterized protein
MLKKLARYGVVLVALSSAPLLQAADDEIIAPTRIENVRVRDGVTIAVAIYLPSGAGRYPTLFAASPYRFDNNLLPPTPQFLWRETGPIKWYLDHGYAFVHMDVRGTGRSDGDYRFLDSKEQTDFFDVIEWVAQQSWSNGKIGGIGQSYYAMTQWFMAAQNPPHLACIAPYDGLIDAYTGIAYSGGIPSKFTSAWYNGELRPLNQYPSTGPAKMLPWDLANEANQHPVLAQISKFVTAADGIRAGTCSLSGSTLIPMVQTANFWEGHDVAGGRLYGTRPRAVLAERKMRSGVMMVVKIAR